MQPKPKNAEALDIGRTPNKTTLHQNKELKQNDPHFIPYWMGLIQYDQIHHDLMSPWAKRSQPMTVSRRNERINAELSNRACVKQDWKENWQD